jgi:hypothetical protein
VGSHRSSRTGRLLGVRGGRRQDRGDALEWLTVKAGPPLPRRFSLGVLHHSPSYAETAGSIEQQPPAPVVGDYLADIAPFFSGAQTILDFAAHRIGAGSPRATVPRVLRVTVDDAAVRDRLRVTLRRVPGVIAVDIYPSRTGFPTTVLWSADVLARSLQPWFERVARASVYRELLGFLNRHGGIGLHLRLQAKQTPGVTWEATMQRTVDGRWRERIDVAFDSDATRERWSALLLPGGWESTIVYYDATVFE